MASRSQSPRARADVTPIAEQLVLNVSLRDAAVFGAYYAGDNATAVNTLEVMAEGSGESQVFLWGPAESGKSHLLQAVCHRAAQCGLSTAYLPLRSVGMQDAAALEGMADLAVLCIDDLDVVTGRPDWEQALFHLINASRAQGHRLVFAAQQNPAYLGVRLPDLASRLLWGPVFRLQPLDDAAKLAALMQRARRRGFELPQEAGQYLLRNCPRDLGHLLEILDRLDTATLAAQRRVTVPFIKAVLGAEGDGRVGES